jgi:hypothetical protein
MPLKDLLKKKDKIKDEGATSSGPKISSDVPEFQFYRTTTSTQETIEPPSFPGDPTREQPLLSPTRAAFGRLRSHSNASSKGSESKLSERLHFGRSRSNSSANVPENLPEVGGDGVARNEDDEAKWEKRATVLVSQGLNHSQPSTPGFENINPMSISRPSSSRSRRSGSVSGPGDDVCQSKEANRLS